ncbi:Uncharacterised protein [Bordetella pertussis]|nr:Uncharacterised protein [Bordetella pertussis]
MACTASQSATCKSACTLPEPDRMPLQPSTSEGMSHALCVVSTLTGRASDCSTRMLRSCSMGLLLRSLMAITEGTASASLTRVSSGCAMPVEVSYWKTISGRSVASAMAL